MTIVEGTVSRSTHCSTCRAWRVIDDDGTCAWCGKRLADAEQPTMSDDELRARKAVAVELLGLGPDEKWHALETWSDGNGKAGGAVDGVPFGDGTLDDVRPEPPAKHSPGPWTWARGQDGLLDAKGAPLLEHSSVWCLPRNLADADLIADAPALLDALEAVWNERPFVGSTTETHTDEAVEALLRKHGRIP